MTKRVAGAVLFLAMFAGACGRGGGGAPASGFAAGATEAGTFKVQAIHSGNESNSRMTGEVDLRRGMSHFAIEFEIPASLRGRAADTGMEAIITPEYMYWKMPSFSAGQEGRKPWVRMRIDELEGYEMASSSVMSVFNPATDPDAFFTALDEVATRLKEVGSLEVRGVATTEFRTVVNLRKLVRRLPAEYRKQSRELLKEVGSRLPMQLFVGEDGLLYRQSYALDQQGEPIEVQLDLYDYGKPVDIREPGPDEYEDVDPNEGMGSTTFSCTGTATISDDSRTVTTTEDC